MFVQCATYAHYSVPRKFPTQAVPRKFLGYFVHTAYCLSSSRLLLYSFQPYHGGLILDLNILTRKEGRAFISVEKPFLINFTQLTAS